MSKDAPPLTLDPELYKNLKEDEIAFLKQLTKIDDDEELKKHVLAIQHEAFDLFPYPCIQGFRFLILKIAKMPIYGEILKLGKERKGAILLDIGCCFGNDPRKAAIDGFPAEQIIASDIQPGFWDLGHKLFKSDPSDFPITFVPGDIFDDNLVKAAGPVPTVAPGVSDEWPRVKDLKLTNSLNPLLGKIAAIHAAAFFHLFDDEEKQAIVAHKLAALLSAESGSIIFGSHAGSPTKGRKATEQLTGGSVFETFCHSPESWKELWEKEVFTNGEVVCDAKNYDFGGDRWLLVWTVTRI